MIISKIWRLRKSLVAQLGVMFAAFLALVLIQLFINISWRFDSRVDGDDFARREVVRMLSIASKEGGGALSAIFKSEKFEKIAAVNPNIRIYFESSRGVVSYGGEPMKPQFQDVMFALNSAPYRLNNVDERKAPEMRGGCKAHMSAAIPFEENEIIGFVFLNNCPGADYYVEIAGIETSPFSRFDLALYDPGVFRFSYFRDYLIVMIGVLMIALFTLYRAAVSLRRVARITQAVDLESGRSGVPEVNLPLEVRPLVRSLNEMLDRIDAAREKQSFFLAAAAHELRTPLTILRGRLEEFPETDSKRLIKVDIKRMSRVIEQLLRLTNLRAVGETKLETIDLVDVAREACAVRAPFAIDRDVEIELLAEQAHVLIRGDAQMILIAITNLLENALSVSRQNTKIIVEVLPRGQLLVRDQGPGIPAGAEQVIFEPFAKNPPNRDGHGLGLAIVNAVMALHRGDASAANAPDGGAVLSLKFELLSLSLDRGVSDAGLNDPKAWPELVGSKN